MNSIVKITLETLLLCSVLLLCSNTLQAQRFRYSIPGLDSLEQDFIVSGASSTVLKTGEAEIISNNTLTSYWLAYHQSSKDSPILDRYRLSQFTSDLFGYYGVSPSGRWDIGVHLRYNRTRIDNAATSSMFRVFQKEESFDEESQGAILDNSFGGLASIGLRFRWKPLRLDPRLLVSGGYSIKTITGEVRARQLAADRNLADIGISYYRELNSHTYYFFGGNGQIYFPTPSITDEYLYNVGANFFLIHRTTNNKFTFYPGLVYSLTFRPSQLESQPHSLIKTTEFVLAYAGLQYAPTRDYNFFLLAGLPLITTVTNPQQEIVRASYSTFTLGFRVGI